MEIGIFKKKYKYKILILILFIFVLVSISIYILFSETIYGYVYRNNIDKPLPYFTFIFEGKRVSTNSEGMFKVRIFPRKRSYNIKFLQENIKQTKLSKSSDSKNFIKLYVDLPPLGETKKGEFTLGERTWGFDFVHGISRRAGFSDEVDISFIAEGGEDIFGNILRERTILANWVADAGIIHLGRVPLDEIDFVPLNGYKESAPLIIGDSYAVYCHMGEGYAKFQILEGKIDIIPAYIKFIYEYQPDGSNRFK